MKNRLPARRALALSLSLSLSSPLISRCRRPHIMSSTDTIGSFIAVHHPIPMVAHHVFNGHDRLSHRRSPPATDGRTLCFQRTISASAAVDVDHTDRSVSIAGAHCTVFFWIGLLKIAFPLLPVLGRYREWPRPWISWVSSRSEAANHAHCSCRKIHHFFFPFTHQALKLIPVVAEFRTLTCSKVSPEIRSQQACVLRVYVCVLYYTSVEEGSSKAGGREREK